MNQVDASSILRSRRTELVQRIAGCGLEVEPTPDEMDRIVSIDLCDTEAIKASALSGDLREVDAALYRIMDGSYGICENCEEHIPQKRLAVVPWARCCVACQEIRDREARDARWSRDEEELAS